MNQGQILELLTGKKAIRKVRFPLTHVADTLYVSDTWLKREETVGALSPHLDQIAVTVAKQWVVDGHPTHHHHHTDVFTKSREGIEIVVATRKDSMPLAEAIARSISAIQKNPAMAYCAEGKFLYFSAEGYMPGQIIAHEHIVGGANFYDISKEMAKILKGRAVLLVDWMANFPTEFTMTLNAIGWAHGVNVGTQLIVAPSTYGERILFEGCTPHEPSAPQNKAVPNVFAQKPTSSCNQYSPCAVLCEVEADQWPEAGRRKTKALRTDIGMDCCDEKHWITPGRQQEFDRRWDLDKKKSRSRKKFPRPARLDWETISLLQKAITP